MRVKAQISACMRLRRWRCGARDVRFRAELSASGQIRRPRRRPSRCPPPQRQRVLKVTPDEAVKMALENNLGLQADRLGPRLALRRGAGEGRLCRHPGSLTTTCSATSPPTDFLNGGDAVLSTDSFRTNAGIGQLMPWGGGRYTLGLDAARATTSNPTGIFNPQLDSGLAGSFTQPLLRNFKFDSFRQNLAVSLKNRRSPTFSSGRR